MLEGFDASVFRTDLPTAEDVDFYLRLCTQGMFPYPAEVFFAYRHTPGSSLSSAKERETVERIFLVKAPALRDAEDELSGSELRECPEVLAEGWRSIGCWASVPIVYALRCSCTPILRG